MTCRQMRAFLPFVFMAAAAIIYSNLTRVLVVLVLTVVMVGMILLNA